MELKKKIRDYISKKKEVSQHYKEKRISQYGSASPGRTKVYENKLMKKINEEDMKVKELDKIKKQEAHTYMRKRKLYSKNVQRLFKVTVSEEKRKELSHLISEHTKPAKEKITKITKNKSYECLCYI